MFLITFVTMCIKFFLYFDLFFLVMCLLIGVFICHIYVTRNLRLAIFCFFLVHNKYVSCKSLVPDLVWEPIIILNPLYPKQCAFLYGVRLVHVKLLSPKFVMGLFRELLNTPAGSTAVSFAVSTFNSVISPS